MPRVDMRRNARKLFAWVTIKTWPKQETTHEELLGRHLVMLHSYFSFDWVFIRTRGSRDAIFLSRIARFFYSLRLSMHFIEPPYNSHLTYWLSTLTSLFCSQGCGHREYQGDLEIPHIVLVNFLSSFIKLLLFTCGLCNRDHWTETIHIGKGQ